MKVCEALLPYVMRKAYGITSVRFDDVELSHLKARLGERLLFTPNHPTNAEPAVMFDLAKRLEKPFYYLSNRESFDRGWGLFGFLLQKCGVYSIIRGAPDRESFKMTRRVLTGAGNQLVIFPEGEVYSQNDSLLPFQAGVFQLAMMAQEDVDNGSIFVIPVAIRYRFTADMGKPIVEAMERLERALALPNPPPGGTYARVRRIGDSVLTAAEETYKLPPGSADDLNPRIFAVREKIIERVADALHVTPESLGKTLPERMRSLMNRLNGATLEDMKVESEYQEKLVREELNRVRPLLRDLRRLANWLAVHDGYVAEHPTQERIVDTLWRLESEVLGKRKLRGPRECQVRIGEAIDLREYREKYAAERRETIQAVTSRVEIAIEKMLEEMGGRDG